VLQFKVYYIKISLLILAVADIRNKWAKLRTTYMRRRKRRAYSKSGSGVMDSNDEDVSINADGLDEELSCPNVTDTMDFIEPYLNIKHSTSNMVRLVSRSQFQQHESKLLFNASLCSSPAKKHDQDLKSNFLVHFAFPSQHCWNSSVLTDIFQVAVHCLVLQHQLIDYCNHLQHLCASSCAVHKWPGLLSLLSEVQGTLACEEFETH
jgi:hypothetical protein